MGSEFLTRIAGSATLVRAKCCCWDAAAADGSGSPDVVLAPETDEFSEAPSKLMLAAALTMGRACFLVSCGTSRMVLDANCLPAAVSAPGRGGGATTVPSDLVTTLEVTMRGAPAPWFMTGSAFLDMSAGSL